MDVWVGAWHEWVGGWVGWVYLCELIRAQGAEVGEDLAGKRLVDFNHVHVLEGETSRSEHLFFLSGWVGGWVGGWFELIGS